MPGTGGERNPPTPATALRHYLDNGDQTYGWKTADTFKIDGIQVYNLVLTSQRWRGLVWRHQLTLFVPPEIKHNEALLFISGGHSDKDGKPGFRGGPDDGLSRMLAAIAATNNAVTAILGHVPNQPLFGGLTEDRLISFTLHNYEEDGDMTWPLLFPMTKAALRAMDAIQEFSRERIKTDIEGFVVSGASKRGWTTWLVGASSDPRVKAIAPMVIDVLNLPVSLNYQIEVWQDYSKQIQDYVKLGIPQTVESESGKSITAMVDPYAYREKLAMPKMIFIGTNDPYWPVDAIKNYYRGIPGENLIHYVPNAGHGLGGNDSASTALSAFFDMTLSGMRYPKCKWKVQRRDDGIDVALETSADRLVGAVVWSAASMDDRDFRNEKWTASDPGTQNGSPLRVGMDFPKNGYKAFYIDLVYKSPAGIKYTQSTRMFVMDSSKLL